MTTAFTIPVALSNRHVHLGAEHVEALFGPGHELTPLRPLSQPGQFAARETVELVGPKGSIPGVRILGPARGQSQVELAITDGYVLGIPVPVRLSGDLAGTPGGHLIGPRGAVRLDEGFIVAARHIHFEPAHAAEAGIEHKQVVAVRVLGRRALVFDAVIARVSDQFKTELHLDVDEGNAAGVRNGDRVEVLSDLCAVCEVGACGVRGVRPVGGSQPYCGAAVSGLQVR